MREERSADEREASRFAPYTYNLHKLNIHKLDSCFVFLVSCHCVALIWLLISPSTAKPTKWSDNKNLTKINAFFRLIRLCESVYAFRYFVYFIFSVWVFSLRKFVFLVSLESIARTHTNALRKRSWQISDGKINGIECFRLRLIYINLFTFLGRTYSFYLREMNGYVSSS